MDNRVTVEILTKDECCLCEEVKKVLKDVQKIRVFDIKEIDITSDAALLERYKEEIPVVLINGRKAFKYRVDPMKLIKRLDRLSKG